MSFIIKYIKKIYCCYVIEKDENKILYNNPLSGKKYCINEYSDINTSYQENFYTSDLYQNDIENNYYYSSDDGSEDLYCVYIRSNNINKYL